MPIIPGYEQRNNIQARQPVPYRNDATERFEANQNVINSLTEVTQAWSDAHDNMQATQAMDKYQRMTAETRLAAQNDKGLTKDEMGNITFTNNSQKYYQQLQKIKDISLNGIDNQAVRNKLSQKFDFDAQMTDIEIRSDFQKKELDHHQAVFSQGLDALVQKRTASSTPAAVMQTSADIKDFINSSVLAGTITEEQSQKVYKDAISRRVEMDMFQNPDFVVSQLEKVDGGIYKDIDFKDRQTLLATASDLKERKAIEVKLLKEQAINENEIATVDQYDTGALTVSQVKSLQTQNKISPNFATVMTKALTSPKAFRAETNLFTYEELLQDVTTRDLSATEIRQKILQANVEGKLSMTDARRLLYVQKDEYGMSTVYGDYLKEMESTKKGKKAQTPKNSFWQSALSLARMTSAPIATMGLIIDEVRKLNAKDEQISDVAREVVRKETLKANPDFSKLPEKGTLHVDKYGNKALVFPDGHWEEVQSAAGEFIHKEQRTKRTKESK